MSENALTVKQFNQMVKVYLESIDFFKNAKISGEISDIKYYNTSGHLYFTLKEGDTTLSCAAFKYRFKGIPADLKVGDKVVITASANFYEKTGRFQVTVDGIKKEHDLGEKYLALEKLKKKLLEKGYFDESAKKKLPKIVQTVGLITSKQGAALHDFVETAKKRFHGIQIFLYNVHVQGSGVEADVVKAIRYFNAFPVDAIVITRGGGSIEDLWGFNSEKIADEIFFSTIPIVSAIGHEVDILLTDLVADLRAATPTQAAERIIPELRELKKDLETYKQTLKRTVSQKLEQGHYMVKLLRENYFLKNIKEQKITQAFQTLDYYREKLAQNIQEQLGKKRQKLDNLQAVLHTLSYENTLKRGYSITTKKGASVSLNDLEVGDILKTEVSSGVFYSEVISREKEKNHEN